MTDREMALIEAGRREAAELAATTRSPAPRADAVPGYELREEIGRGGMGVVHKALQLSTRRLVALKVLLGGAFASPAARQRFQREIENAARCQHPGIARILESGVTVDGQPYYAMDYVVGVRLSDWLAMTVPAPRQILTMFELICDAVEHAHRNGVVHRDLKPANVLVDAESRPHILDFGLSKATEPGDVHDVLSHLVSRPGQIVGTPLYLSPEQADGRGDAVDARTDVYALGLMLCEALTGELPYDRSGSLSAVVRRICDDPPRRPSMLARHVDRELDTIILKALEKEPVRRYASAGELGADMGRYLRGEPIVARLPSGLYRLRKWTVRHRAWFVLGAMVVLAAAGGVGAATWWRDRAQSLQRAGRMRAACFTALDALRNLEAGQIAVALSEAAAAYAACPDLPCVKLAKAQTLFQGASAYEAVVFLLRELANEPSSWACRLLLVEILDATGDRERARAVEQAARGPIPGDAESWYLRSFATLHPPRALEFAGQAVARDPRHVLAWRRLAYLQLLQGHWGGALHSTQRLQELDDSRSWVWLQAAVLFRLGQRAEAFALCDQVVERTSRPLAYRKRGSLHLRAGHLDQARADFTTALQRSDNRLAERWTLYARGTVLWMLGRPAEALDDYGGFRRLHGEPSYADVRSYLILRQCDQSEQAGQLLDDMLEDKRCTAWLRKIGLCLHGDLPPKGLIDAADPRDLEQVCEAYYYAGEACLLVGDRAAAHEYFEKCVATGVECDLNDHESPMAEYLLAGWRLGQLASAGDR